MTREVHVVHHGVAYNISGADIAALEAERLAADETVDDATWLAGTCPGMWLSADSREGSTVATLPLRVALDCVQPASFTFVVQASRVVSRRAAACRVVSCRVHDQRLSPQSRVAPRRVVSRRVVSCLQTTTSSPPPL